MDTVGDAIDLITWWLRHSVPYGLLQDKHRTVHGKTSGLTLPVVTRWGSHYNAIKQLLQSQQVMNLLVLEKRGELLKSVGNKKPAKDKAEKMLDLACDSTFWSALKVVLDQLGPLLVSMSGSCLTYHFFLSGHSRHCARSFLDHIIMKHINTWQHVYCRLQSGLWSLSRPSWTKS